MDAYPISPDEFIGTPANAGDAASSAGFLLDAIHKAYDAADKLQNVTGYTRDMAYKALDAIRITVQDDLTDVPPDPTTAVDDNALWWPPLKRDMLMGWQTVKQVNEKAGQTVSLGDYLGGIVSKTPAAITNAAAPLVAPVFGGALLVLVVVGVLLIFVLNSSGAALLGKVL